MEPDIFDEFEFKPLTKGLGFHRKSEVEESIKPKRNKTSAPSAASEFPTDKTREKTLEKTSSVRPPEQSSPLPSLSFENSPTLSLDFSENETLREEESKLAPEVSMNPETVYSPIGRKNYEKPKEALKVGRPVSSYSKRSVAELERAFPGMKFSKASGEQQTIVQPKVKRYSLHLGAVFIDCVFVGGLAVFFLLMGLQILNLDPLIWVLSLGLQQAIFWTGGFFLLWHFAYLFLSRVFFLSTLGEWTFELKVLPKVGVSSFGYCIRIVFRYFLVLLTGFFTIALISRILKKDYLYKCTGLTVETSQD